MSVSEAAPPAESRDATQQKRGLEKASLKESGQVVLAAMVPAVVRGLFKPRRGTSKRLTEMNADGKTVNVLSGIRRKYGGQGVQLFGGRMAVVWGADAMREVLDTSADVYASDAGAKKKGMCHFQPDALTISRGDEWQDRRRFTDAVLAPGERVHPLGDRFVRVVSDEVDRLRIGGSIEWSHYETLFDRVTLRVVFGDKARDDQELTDLLARLMCEANRIVAGEAESSDAYHDLHGRMEWHMREPEEGSLASLFADAPQTDRTRPVHQLTHWIFAMRDTLGLNAYRALAAIVADPAVEERVREEIEGKDLSDASTIDGLRYLEGCFQEAMRLWPSTPLLARETTRETELAGEKLDEGTQVMIVNTFNHRDPESVADADRLKPERWETDQRDYRFNHLSNGSQWCPGEPLVLLLGKAAIAQTLVGWDLTMEEPRLEAGRPLPNMLDFFQVRFTARRRP